MPTLLREIDVGSLTCAQISICAKGGAGGRVRHKQVCTRVDTGGQKKTVSLCLLHQGIEPRVLGFEFHLSNHWATSPSPPEEVRNGLLISFWLAFYSTGSTCCVPLYVGAYIWYFVTNRRPSDNLGVLSYWYQQKAFTLCLPGEEVISSTNLNVVGFFQVM